MYSLSITVFSPTLFLLPVGVFPSTQLHLSFFPFSSSSSSSFLMYIDDAFSQTYAQEGLQTERED